MPGFAAAQPASAGPADAKLIEDLVAANLVLAMEGVLDDGYGHVSVRHDKDPNRYLMARSVAPQLVSAADIMEFDLDSNPVEQRGRAMYNERFIHGEIYKARPDVKVVVHNHSPSLIPFGVSGVPLAVGRSIYLEMNARLQAQAAALGGNITFLEAEEVRLVEARQDYRRAWDLWRAKAGVK